MAEVLVFSSLRMVPHSRTTDVGLWGLDPGLGSIYGFFLTSDGLFALNTRFHPRRG